MPRYFFNIAYNGTAYSGLQKQPNANSIEQELEKALNIYFAKLCPQNLTSASRTDAGVHAHHNVFHIDFNQHLNHFEEHIYRLNTILPKDIVLKKIQAVIPTAHARFDAISRTYQYFLYTQKNPFLDPIATYFPYPVNFDLLNLMSEYLLSQKNFTSFSKKHTQNFTPICQLTQSIWKVDAETYTYQVTANRFLRGMVRALVCTMLYHARKEKSLESFKNYFIHLETASALFNVPAKGLFLTNILYPNSCFETTI